MAARSGGRVHRRAKEDRSRGLGVLVTIRLAPREQKDSIHRRLILQAMRLALHTKGDSRRNPLGRTAAGLAPRAQGGSSPLIHAYARIAPGIRAEGAVSVLLASPV